VPFFFFAFRFFLPLLPGVVLCASLLLQKELFCIKKSHHSRGPVLFRWDPSNKYIASVGSNRRVNIFDRSGAQIDEFALTGKPNNAPLQIEWDKEGENLAVLCDGQCGAACRSGGFETAGSRGSAICNALC
jgi:hypothetical protein